MRIPITNHTVVQFMAYMFNFRPEFEHVTQNQTTVGLEFEMHLKFTLFCMFSVM